jgi:hypothetical protein
MAWAPRTRASTVPWPHADDGYGERPGIIVAGPGRRHYHCPIDACRIHFPQHFLAAEPMRSMRQTLLRFRPRPLGSLGFPQMNLSVGH